MKTPPNGADWIHEIKHGGYRTISVTNAAIGSGLRLLECQVEAEYRKAVQNTGSDRARRVAQPAGRSRAKSID